MSKGAEAYLRGRSTDPATVALRADDGAGTISPSTSSDRPPTSSTSSPGRPSGSSRRRVGTDPAALRPGAGFVVERRIRADRHPRPRALTLTANTHYWAGHAGHLDDRARRRPRWAQPGRGVRERRARLHRREQRRRVVDRLRQDARSAAPQGRARCRSSTTASTRRKPPFDDVRVRRGLRRGRRLAPDGGAERVRARRSRSRTRWYRRGSRVGATPTSCPGTTPPMPASCSPRPAIRAAPGSRHGPDDRRQRVRRGDRRRGQARARDHPSLGDDGRRLLRPARLATRRRCGRSAGSRTTRVATTSSACCSGRARRTTTATGARASSMRPSPKPSRRRIRRSPRPPTTGPRRIVRDEVPVVPLLYGPGWSLSRTGLLGAGQNGLGHRAHGGAGMGGLMRRRVAGPARRGLAACSGSRRSPAPRRRRGPTSGHRRASSSFEAGVEFRQPVTVAEPAGRVELLLTSADAIGPTVVVVPGPPTTGSATLTYRLDPADGHILAEHPDGRALAADRRRRSDPDPTRTGRPDRVRGRPVHLEDRDRRDRHASTGTRAPTPFGKRALKIAEDAIAETSKLLGVTETEPVDFYIYADETAFRDAIGPGLRENVGGLAVPGIRTLFALIPPESDRRRRGSGSSSRTS